MVQKYAVVDANHVSAPLGATWGNVGRFLGALGGSGTRRNRRLKDLKLQSAMRRSTSNRTPREPRRVLQALPGSRKRLPHVPTILSLSFSQADAKPAFTLECPLLVRHLSVRRP